MMLHATVARALDAFATQMRCPICLEALERPFSLPCNHCFCEACINTALSFATTCPVCKAAVRKRTLRHDGSVQRIQDALQKLMAMRPVVEAPPPAATMPTSICIDLCSEESDEQSNSITQATQIDAPPIVPVAAPEAEMHEILPPATPPRTQVFAGGQVVEVSARTWPGINKLGGTAWIVRRNDDGTYNVKYVLGGREGRVDPAYIRSAGTSNDNNNNSDDANPSPATSSARATLSRKRLSPAIESPPPVPLKKKKAAQSTIREALVFLCSGLNHDEKTLVESCAQLLGATTVHEWTESVTHVIVKCQHAAPMRQKLQLSDKVKRWVKIRSIKYLKAVVSGRWIVSDAWILACVKAKALVSEESYEVQGLLKVQHVPEIAKKARLLRQANLATATCLPSAVGTRLFASLVCVVYGNFASPLPPKHEIGSLVRLGDGTVVASLDELVRTAAQTSSRTCVVIVEAMDVVLPLPTTAAGLTIYAVGYEWVLDSVSECALKPLAHLLQT
ncbi:hypothetical protein SPRG_07296 [Saprolegnia parasitica CBS 223.65]|uniref:RING-type E3 ubiquitin transferase BRCA1 n=1 Tax=Saprolegnia parasitica (strain CBS 223.65) TaxID=695850 RepID=A0A067CMD3_SAPPC|nr:hypothetical protein SPRG_07296 [Saprolegnia parasitica CBS 223.65]KDO27666.1 hypothetical protein SPRG_07296 [Saprolegnia parasitica CBS 223.65]|eukprot:XP_012201478.1 hypothetical protein SPRG_07296 [Saprolegnia parasitica CBS 223.65]